jgi:hypothetical protein
MSEDFGTQPLALERYLEDEVNQNRDAFPDRNVNYFSQYENIKGSLKRSHFRDANTGLAVDGNRYTHHDLGHVNDVIEMAGSMLRVQDSFRINGYETYILLVGILLHDSGNSEGRNGHEQKTFRILMDMGELAGLNTVEKKLISKIAMAHGGTFNIGNFKTKDTISNQLQNKEDTFRSGEIKVRSRALAAILRLADELSEKQSRANKAAVADAFKKDAIPLKPDVVHNIFCHIVRMEVNTEYNEIKLFFDIEKCLLQRYFTIEEKDIKGEMTINDIYLADYIIRRLKKCNLERQYCNRHMFGVLTYDLIHVQVNITHEHEDLKTWKFKIEDTGYPEDGDESSIRNLSPDLDGITLYQKYKD